MESSTATAGSGTASSSIPNPTLTSLPSKPANTQTQTQNQSSLQNNSSSQSQTVINGIKLSSNDFFLHSLCPFITFLTCLLPCNIKNGVHLDEPDATKVVTVMANDGKTGDSMELSYTNYKVIGNGSFGVVFQAKLLASGEYGAIKKVLQDKRFKVRFAFSYIFFCIGNPVNFY
jgi:hypothetical protein